MGQVKFDKEGREIPDPTPVAVPVRFRAGPSMVDEIRDAVRREVSKHAQSHGYESFEEADDFDVEDDPMPVSPHELSPEIEGLPRYSELGVRRRIDKEWEDERVRDRGVDDRGGAGDRSEGEGMAGRQPGGAGAERGAKDRGGAGGASDR